MQVKNVTYNYFETSCFLHTSQLNIQQRPNISCGKMLGKALIWTPKVILRLLYFDILYGQETSLKSPSESH